MTSPAEMRADAVAEARPRPASLADLKRGLRLLLDVRERGLGAEIDKAADAWIARYVEEIRTRATKEVSIEEARRLAG